MLAIPSNQASMNFFTVSSGVNFLCTISIALFIFLRPNRKSIQTSFAIFSLLLSLWSFFYILWAIERDFQKSYLWAMILACPIMFIHSTFFHFTLLFCDKYREYKNFLTLGYILSVVFLLIHLSGGLFIPSSRSCPPFVNCPNGSHLLLTFIGIEILFVLFSFIIIARTAVSSLPPLKARYMVFLIAAITGWTGGLTNWSHFFDTSPLKPIGNPGVTIFMIIIFYLTIKHDILQLNLMIRRTVLYAFLTLAISLTYALIVTLCEKLFQSYMGYSSIIGTFTAALLIAISFNPLRSAIAGFVDRRFMGGSVEKLMEENLQMRSQLQNQDRMKAVATLATGMAHEIKNPLTSIKTFAEYLPKKYHDAEFREKFSRIVVDEVDRVNNIVKQLLEFSKPSELDLKPILVSGLLEDTLSLLTNNLIGYKIELAKDFDTYAMITGDKNQLRQAFLNLFLNSIQSMTIGGILKVSCITEVTGWVRISITDSGCGISKDNLSHIFDPFYTTKEDGTGLGLAIVHSIITKHEGRIRVQSEVGKGTVVNVFLKSPN